MPIFEYECRGCGERFEDLIRNRADEDALACPSCGSKDLAKQMSAFGVRGDVEKPVSATSASCAGCTAASCAGCR